LSHLSDILWIELRKALRSRMPLWTALGFLLLPLVSTLMIFILKNPELSRKLGLITAKANLLVGSADWPGYLKLLLQSAVIGGFFLFCIIISWVFGREFTDGTIKDLLAVPVPRSSLILGKFILVAIWSLALALEIFVAGLLLGAVIKLPQGTTAVILQGSFLLLVSSCLAIVTVMPFAFFASVGRGYLLPLGMVIVVLILANTTIVTGWGDYFPWAIPGLLSQGYSLSPISFVIVLLTGLIGIIATHLWWKYADQSR